MSTSNSDSGTNQAGAAQAPAGVQGTDPDESGVPEAQDQGDSSQSGDEGLQLDGLGEDGAPKAPEVETEEIERNGKKYVIPKELKPALMFNDDYTRKTQELATARQQQQEAFAQREQALAYQAQAQQQHLKQYGELAALDQQLTQYGAVNWQHAMAQDPQSAQAAWMQYQQLKEQRTGVAQTLQQSETQLVQRMQAQAQQQQAQAMQAAHAVVSKWTPDVAAAVETVGAKAYGLTPQLFDKGGLFTLNPGLLNILHDAVQYRQMMNKATSAAAKPQAKPQAVEPSLSLPQGSGPATPKGLDSKSLSVDDWMKRRNEQLSKRNKR